jgi:hypothetical protein
VRIMAKIGVSLQSTGTQALYNGSHVVLGWKVEVRLIPTGLLHFIFSSDSLMELSNDRNVFGASDLRDSL